MRWTRSGRREGSLKCLAGIKSEEILWPVCSEFLSTPTTPRSGVLTWKIMEWYVEPSGTSNFARRWVCWQPKKSWSSKRVSVWTGLRRSQRSVQNAVARSSGQIWRPIEFNVLPVAMVTSASSVSRSGVERMNANPARLCFSSFVILLRTECLNSKWEMCLKITSRPSSELARTAVCWFYTK